MKSWEPHTKKIKYCLSENFDDNNNTFGKGWSPGSELRTVKNTSTLTTVKHFLSDHMFIKDDIFDVKVIFPLRGNPIGIVSQYCEHHNISYIYQSTKNIPQNHDFTERNRTNACILRIGIK